MKAILDTFKQSIYNPSFYTDAPTRPLSEIFLYYIKLTLLLSLLMTIALGILLVPKGVTFVEEHAGDTVKSYYPAELVIHIENGEVSTNVPMPYVIPMKYAGGIVPPKDAMQNILAIDTTHEFDTKTFEDSKTYALLTKKEIVTRDDNGQITIKDLRGAPTTTISQEILLSWIEKIRHSLSLIVFVGIIITFIILTFGYLAYLFPLLLFALVPFFIAWMKKTPLTYAGAFKMSLYAIVPALALKTLLNIAGVFFVPSYFTLLVFMLIIALNMRETNQPKLFGK